jgi:hypothetical protein
MAYDYVTIADRIRVTVAECPAVGLKSICADLGISRHTAARALSTAFGIHYRDLQKESLSARYSALKRAVPLLHEREIARRLGYASAGSLGRRLGSHR